MAMKLLVQVSSQRICAGMVIDHNQVEQAAPVLRAMIRAGETWPVIRTRLLSQGFGVFERMIDFLGDPPHGPERRPSSRSRGQHG
jgi:hypothetical protein